MYMAVSSKTTMEVAFGHKGLLKQNYMKSGTREERRQEEDGEQE